MRISFGDLRRGNTGPSVQQLQADLVKLGYMTQAQMNTGPGTFGPQTEASLKNFQRDAGLPITGIADAKTMNALNRSTVSQGSIEPEIVTPSRPSVPWWALLGGGLLLLKVIA